MTKRGESLKIAAKKKKWDKEMRPVDKFFNAVKKIIKEEKNKMMYGKKEKDRIDRFAYELIWWFKLIIVFMAFSYLTGR
jgi:cytochrome c2